MKRIFSLLVFMTICAFLPRHANTQAPEKMSYQAVIRNAGGQLVTSQSIGIRIQILQSSEFGAAVYVETHTRLTNANGLVTLEIGEGAVVMGSFSGINWAAGPYYLKTEIDPTGGTSYSIIGTNQLLSVSYALHAKESNYLKGSITESQISDLKNYLTAESDPVFSASPAQGITGTNITNWNNKLDSYTETDPVFGTSVASNITTLDTANWNSAFGWGNHAGLYRSDSWVPSWTDVTDKPSVFPPSAHSHSAADINSGTLDVARGGTGLASYTEGNYIRASGATTLEQRTPAQVRADIDAGTVNSIATGNGITGGTITTTGTLGLTGQALALHNLGANGIIARTGAGTVAARTITAGTGITVSNGNGVSDNPTIAAKTYAIGDFAHGGIVFWVDATGQHGLVCAKTDQSTGVRWYAGTNTNTMARGSGTKAGFMNTAIIIANQGYGDGSTYAARICNELAVTEDGKTYGDWYLPSAFELNLMFIYKTAINNTATANGGSAFASAWYWSSTEYNSGTAWRQDGGTTNNGEKDNAGRVRAVRAF